MIQEAAPLLLYLPGGQVSISVAPWGQNFPALQETQAEDLSVLAYVPSEHVVHVLAPAPLKDPALQLCISVASSSHAVPGSQMAH